jgi:hypothetical protein
MTWLFGDEIDATNEVTARRCHAGEDVPSQPDLFKAAIEVLRREMRPMKYRIVARACLAALGYDASDAFTLDHAAEDIRWPLSQHRNAVIGYVGRPESCLFLYEWFATNVHIMTQAKLFESFDYEWVIPLSQRVTFGAGVQACAMVAGGMINKYGSSPHAVGRRSMRGMTAEDHVSAHVRERWPKLWRPPSSRSRPVSDDFNLLLDLQLTRLVDVDVAHRNADGTFFGVPMKRPASLNLAADLDEDAGVVRVIGWQDRAGASMRQRSDGLKSMGPLTVRLNMYERDLKIRAFRLAIREGWNMNVSAKYEQK